jgi:FkbM family methyltransferase
MVLDANLIYDIGLHTGRDSEFYLKKGFKVVGVEANPEMAERAAVSLSEYLNAGQFNIVQKALSDSSGALVSFFVNDEKDDWSSLSQAVAEKNITGSREITVTTTTLSDIYAEFGVPYYLKCDIEGGDELVAIQMTKCDTLPEYVSFEITTVSMLGILWGAGYRRFQLVNQALNFLTQPPSPALEGVHIARQFDGHCSGLFGRELSESRWIDIERVTSLYLDFIDLRDRYDQLCMGWLDVHATR